MCRRPVLSLTLMGLVFIMATGCQSKPQTAASAPAQPVPTWAGQMQGMADEVRELIPFIYSRQAFVDPVHRDRIQAGLKKLGSQAHVIKPDMAQGFFGDDPLVDYSLSTLQDDLKRASESFEMGQLEYSRGVAKAVMNHCFRCHSVTKVGAQAKWDVGELSALRLAPLDRVDLMVASRKYDEAVKYLEGVLGSQDFVQNSPFDYEAALRKYLSLMIRADGNPDRPLKELDRVLALKGVPFYVSEQARSWRQSLQEWQNNLKTRKALQGDLMKQAKERIAKGDSLQQYAKDHAGDIEYLRATALLHQYLKGAKDVTDKAEAYYLLGRAYEVLDELGYWNLHEVYYEACINEAPKTKTAKSCYARLEASVYLGFSGSSGVHVPANEKARLKRLKEKTL